MQCLLHPPSPLPSTPQFCEETTTKGIATHTGSPLDRRHSSAYYGVMEELKVGVWIIQKLQLNHQQSYSPEQLFQHSCNPQLHLLSGFLSSQCFHSHMLNVVIENPRRNISGWGVCVCGGNVDLFCVFKALREGVGGNEIKTESDKLSEHARLNLPKIHP